MEFDLKNTRPRTPPKRKKEEAVFDPTPKRYNIPKVCPLPPIHKKPQVRSIQKCEVKFLDLNRFWVNL